MAVDEDEAESIRVQRGSSTEDMGLEDTTDGAGPDTSSFSAFLASFFAPLDPKDDEESGDSGTESESESETVSNANHELGGIDENQGSTEKNSGLKMKFGVGKNDYEGEVKQSNASQGDEGMPVVDLPEMSDPSKLLSNRYREFLYISLPILAKGRKWVLLYSTWKHGISLSTLYRRSKLYEGLSVLVVGDQHGAVFGGLVEAPLTTQSRKYQGTNSTFLFSDVPGHPVIYHPTGLNRYFTLCSQDHIALGGGHDHFALYLDEDLLNGSSHASETYGNPCLASSQQFVVKEVELWAFVFASKYEELLALCGEDAPGISRW